MCLKEQRIDFEAVIHLSLQNSFGTMRKSRPVEVECTVGIKNVDNGWFELYDTETGGEDWYAEGGLWFRDGKLYDYDGVFSLPSVVLQKLKEMGVDTSDMD